jgi:hypothetical protein
MWTFIFIEKIDPLEKEKEITVRPGNRGVVVAIRLYLAYCTRVFG